MGTDTVVFYLARQTHTPRIAWTPCRKLAKRVHQHGIYITGAVIVYKIKITNMYTSTSNHKFLTVSTIYLGTYLPS